MKVRPAASQAFAGNGWNGNVSQRLERHRSQGLRLSTDRSNGWNGSVDRLSQAFSLSEAFTGFQKLSQAFQRPFQRLERQPSLAFTFIGSQRMPQFTGFHRLSRNRSNGWNGSADRLSLAFQKSFQRLKRQRESFPETVPTIGTSGCFRRLSKAFQSLFQRLERQRS